MRTETPDVFAVGECVEYEGNLFGLVAPLYDQAKVLAKTLLGEEETRRGLDAKWVGMRGLDVRMMAIGGPMR